jgi:hypothetical protein
MPVAPPIAPEVLVRTVLATLSSQLEGRQGAELAPGVFVWVRRSLYRHGCQSYDGNERCDDEAHFSFLYGGTKGKMPRW